MLITADTALIKTINITTAEIKTAGKANARSLPLLNLACLAANACLPYKHNYNA